MKNNVLEVEVEIDPVLQEACTAFDYSFSGRSRTELPAFDAPARDGSWTLGVIVGASGSGKTSLLRRSYGTPTAPEWAPNKAIVSHFQNAKEAIAKLTGVGLSSIPAWCRPYSALSTGERFRADLARGLGSNASFDEFTSVVDRSVAKAASRGLSRYVRRNALTGITIASCHRDILEWLEPDWVFDTDLGSFLPRGSLPRRPEIRIDLYRCNRSLWDAFKRHHYLTSSLMCSARCWSAFWQETLVGFVSAVTMPGGTVKKAWREHRTVVLPDYQGLGIGVRISDAIANRFIQEGCRYFSKTAHPRMGGYRDGSPLWRGTSKNHVVRKDTGCQRKWEHRTGVFLWSHEYVGCANKPVVTSAAPVVKSAE